MIELSALILPTLFLGLSIAIILVSRRPVADWLGKKYDQLSPFPIFVVFAQLLVLSLATEFLSTNLGIDDTQNVTSVARAFARTPETTIPTLLISGMGEELLFRGILYPLLGIGLSSALFAFAHAGYGSIIQLLAAFVAGIILVHARTQNESIFPGAVGHFLYNGAAIFILAN